MASRVALPDLCFHFYFLLKDCSNLNHSTRFKVLGQQYCGRASCIGNQLFGFWDDSCPLGDGDIIENWCFADITDIDEVAGATAQASRPILSQDKSRQYNQLTSA